MQHVSVLEGCSICVWWKGVACQCDGRVQRVSVVEVFCMRVWCNACVQQNSSFGCLPVGSFSRLMTSVFSFEGAV